MATCAVGGQAVGTAAAMASKKSLSPREFGKKHIQELRQELLKDDCFIPGLKNNDTNDLALRSSVSATSGKTPASSVINGYSRNIDDDVNEWISDGIRKEGEILTLKLEKLSTINQVRITFDPDLSEERCISVSKAFLEKEPLGPAKDLVKDYSVKVLLENKVVFEKKYEGNYQRHCITDLDEPTVGDEIEITVFSTNGAKDAKIFEVRVY